MDIQDAAMQPMDWAPYKRRSAFTRFELASLLHRQDPERLFNRAWDSYHEYEDLCVVERDWIREPEHFAALIDDRPGLLGEDVSSTFKSLKKAYGGRYTAPITFAQSQIFAGDLGIEWPAELIGPEAAQDAAKKPVGVSVTRHRLLDRGDPLSVLIEDAWREAGGDPRRANFLILKWASDGLHGLQANNIFLMHPDGHVSKKALRERFARLARRDSATIDHGKSR